VFPGHRYIVWVREWRDGPVTTMLYKFYEALIIDEAVGVNPPNRATIKMFHSRKTRIRHESKIGIDHDYHAIGCGRCRLRVQ